MSDLQCPAVVVLIAREFVTSPGTATALAARRPARVFVTGAIAGDPVAHAAAAGLARQAACPIEALAEAADGVTLARAVDELADSYRGESIALVASDDAIRTALGCARAPEEPVTIAIDSSGWSIVDPR